MKKDALLQVFGECYAHVRDDTISANFNVIKGQIKDRVSQKIAETLENVSQEQKKAIQALILDTVDGALNKFLWMMEQHEEFDIIAYEDGKSYSLRDISDGLSVEYWNFVDDYSKMPRELYSSEELKPIK